MNGVILHGARSLQCRYGTWMFTAVVVAAILILVAAVVHIASRPPRDLVERRGRWDEPERVND